MSRKDFLINSHSHAPITRTKKNARTIVHHIPFLNSSSDTRSRTQRAIVNVVYTKTAPVTTVPGSQFPKSGANQPHCVFRVPARDTTSETGVATSEVDTSEPGVRTGRGAAERERAKQKVVAFKVFVQTENCRINGRIYSLTSVNVRR